MVLDNAGNLFVADYNGGTIGTYNASTGAAINASLITGLTTPRDLTFDANGTLYVSSIGNNGVRAYNASTGAPVTGPVLGSITNTWGIAFDEANNFFVSAYFAGNVAKLTASGTTISNPLIGSLGAAGPTTLIYIVPEPGVGRLAGIALAAGCVFRFRRRARGPNAAGD